jgi:hypothetical protein
LKSLASAQKGNTVTEVLPVNSAVTCSGRRSRHINHRRRLHSLRVWSPAEPVFGVAMKRLPSPPHVWLATHGNETLGQCERTSSVQLAFSMHLLFGMLLRAATSQQQQTLTGSEISRPRYCVSGEVEALQREAQPGCY